MKTITIAIALALAVSSLNTRAQDEGGDPPPPPEGPPPSESGPQGGPVGKHKRPMPPLDAVLDANGDGVIDADEIVNAAKALKKLDKNGDGKLTPDEYRPPHPPEDGRRGCPDSHRPDDSGAGQSVPQSGSGNANP